MVLPSFPTFFGRVSFKKKNQKKKENEVKKIETKRNREENKKKKPKKKDKLKSEFLNPTPDEKVHLSKSHPPGVALDIGEGQLT